MTYPADNALSFPAKLAQPLAMRRPGWVVRVNWRSVMIFLFVISVTITASIGVAFVAASFRPLVAAALIVGLMVGILFVTRPLYALMLMVIFIPMNGLDQYFPGGLSAVKVAGLVTLGCFFVYWLMFARERQMLRGIQTWLILLFLLIGLVGLFFANYPAESFDALFRFFRLFLLYLVVYNLVDTPERAKGLVLALVIGVCISAAFGLDAYLTTHLKNFRAVGLTTQPNTFGNTTALMAPAALALAWSVRSRLARALLIGAAILLVTGVIISFSRGSLLGLLACLPLLIWRLGGRNPARILAAVGIVAAVVIPFVPARYYDRLATLEDTSADFSVMRRETYLIFAQRLFFEHPLIGIGLSNFEELYAQSEYRILLNEQDKIKGRPAHNMYVHIAVEMGVLGIGLFLSLFVVSWRDLWRSQASFKQQGDMTMLHLAQGLEVSLLCLMVLGLFGSRQYEEFPWLFFALSGAMARLARPARHARTPGSQVAEQAPAVQVAGN